MYDTKKRHEIKKSLQILLSSFWFPYTHLNSIALCFKKYLLFTYNYYSIHNLFKCLYSYKLRTFKQFMDSDIYNEIIIIL